MHTGLIEALAAHAFVPVFAGVALKNSGLLPFIDFMADIGPDPRTAKDVSLNAEGEQVEIPLTPDKPLSALVI
jgi:elongation factor G